jgi:hypothetical protein
MKLTSDKPGDTCLSRALISAINNGICGPGQLSLHPALLQGQDTTSSLSAT